jgi:hypothetical protein
MLCIETCFVVHMEKLVLRLKSFVRSTPLKAELNLDACRAEEYSHVGFDDLA